MIQILRWRTNTSLEGAWWWFNPSEWRNDQGNKQYIRGYARQCRWSGGFDQQREPRTTDSGMRRSSRCKETDWSHPIGRCRQARTVPRTGTLQVASAHAYEALYKIYCTAVRSGFSLSGLFGTRNRRPLHNARVLSTQKFNSRTQARKKNSTQVNLSKSV